MIVDKCPITGGPDGGSSAWSHIGVFNAHKEAFQRVWIEHLYCLFAESFVFESISVGNGAYLS